MFNFFYKKSIYIVVVIALVVRVVNINQSLWLDETISALAARDFSFFGIVFDFLKADNHPPLFYLVLRLWGLLFGFSDLSLRMLPIILGCLTVWLSYLLIKKVTKNYSISLIGALLLALSPLHIYYSQEIRMYPMVACLAVGLVYLFSFLMDKEAKVWQWILFSTLIVALIATDYTGLFLLPTFVIFGLVSHLDKKWLGKLTVSFIPLGIVGLWWLPIFTSQSATARQLLTVLPEWKNLAGGISLKEVIVWWMKFVLGRIIIQPRLLYYGLVGLFSLPILLTLFLALKKWRQNLLMWSYLIIPLIASLVVSLVIPAFSYFRMIYLLPAFYGLIAGGIDNLKGKFRLFVLTLILTGNILGIGFYFFDIQNQREQWKQALVSIEHNSTQNSGAVFEFPEPFAPFKWYSTGRVVGIGALDSLSSHQELTDQKIRQSIEGKDRIFYFSYLKDLTDPSGNVEKSLQKIGYTQKSSKSFVGVGEVKVYEK